MHYEAHFSDLEHEIKPVTSGYRFVLVYSLCSDGNIDECIKHDPSYEKISYHDRIENKKIDGDSRLINDGRKKEECGPQSEIFKVDETSRYYNDERKNFGCFCTRFSYCCRNYITQEPSHYDIHESVLVLDDGARKISMRSHSDDDERKNHYKMVIDGRRNVPVRNSNKSSSFYTVDTSQNNNGEISYEKARDGRGNTSKHDKTNENHDLIEMVKMSRLAGELNRNEFSFPTMPLDGSRRNNFDKRQNEENILKTNIDDGCENESKNNDKKISKRCMIDILHRISDQLCSYLPTIAIILAMIMIPLLPFLLSK